METSTVSAGQPAAHTSTMAPADRRAGGKRLRDTAPRDAHAAWRAPADRRDPIGILQAADATRQPDLVPLRYGRMLQSPFTFYRGSAGVMAADLDRTPVSGIHVQVCGDCHLMNFGGFATPERRLIFDINDLDETLPAPWEWDVKRLVASFVLAARANGLSDAQGRDAAIACARSYRRHGIGRQRRRRRKHDHREHGRKSRPRAANLTLLQCPLGLDAGFADTGEHAILSA